MTTPRLEVSIHGDVLPIWRANVEETLSACYRRLPCPGLVLVQVCLLDTVARLRDFLAAEQTTLGIISPVGVEFLATHDAWHGVPRITACAERLNSVPADVAQGALCHEAGHTILHGSAEHYRFRLSRETVERGAKRGLDAHALQQVLYYVAIAVKDYEVARLLAAHGYAEGQAALARHQMVIDENDRRAWELASAYSVVRLICLTAQLKLLLFVQPLAEHVPALAGEAQAMLSFLPIAERERLWRVTGEIGAALGDDSKRNIGAALELVLDRL